METVRDVCKYIGGIILECPICVETGCTYVVDKENLIHTTTNNIFDYIVEPNSGDLYSLDIDEGHIKAASSLLRTSCTNNLSTHRFILGDSVESMKDLCVSFGRDFDTAGVDVLWLDSKEFDEDHMVNEYYAIKGVLSKKHFVLVDDIHNDNSVKYKKMVPILKSMGYNYTEVPTPTGLFMASIGYSLGN